jgi:hypothetical protein
LARGCPSLDKYPAGVYLLEPDRGDIFTDMWSTPRL